MYIALRELQHCNSVVFLCVDCVCMSIHTPTEMSCVPISSFHHSEEPIWASGCCRLPGNGLQRCHASGVPVPGSGVGQSVLLLLQRPHQTTGVGVRVCVYACVGEVGCACVQFGIRVYMCVSVYLCLYMHPVQLHQCYMYAANYCHPVMSSTSCSPSEHPN